MPNPYNTRSAAQGANGQPEDTQAYSQDMANQNFVPQDNGQQQTMGQQTMGQQTMGQEEMAQNIGQTYSGQDMGQTTQSTYTQDTSYNQEPAHEQSLADKVENMLEKLANKITGHDHVDNNNTSYK